MCLIPSLSKLHDSVLYYLVDVYFLLADEVFKTKTLKPILFNFTFEIVLDCSSSSLRTISGTNIFGVVVSDEAEVYLPWDIIIHLILRGEQSQKIF